MDAVYKDIADGKLGAAFGEIKGKAELIQMMLNTGNSVNDIAKVTGLSVDEIQKLI